MYLEKSHRADQWGGKMKNTLFYLQLISFVLFFVFSAVLNASGGLTGPTSSSTGNYTISSINNACGLTANKTNLHQQPKESENAVTIPEQ